MLGLFLVQPQGERDGECGSRHAQHGECDRDEGFLQSAGATHARDNVAGLAGAQLVTDAVHHAAHQQAIQAQAHGPQQQCAAVQPPGQPEGVAQLAVRAVGARAFGDEPGADVAAGEQPVRHRGQHRRRGQMQQQHPPVIAGVRPHL